LTDLGTWKVSHTGFDTNVAILARAINPKSSDNVVQMVYYQRGVGTNISKWDKLFGGAFGDGLCDNVRDAYLFISLNWLEGDEIYLFGFSRGAYTAHTIARLICGFGLLTKSKNYVSCTEGFDEVFRQYKSRSIGWIENMRKKYEPVCGVPIKFMGVWDMVGSLGTFERSRLKFGKSSETGQGGPTCLYREDEIPSGVQHVFHAYFPLTLS
jgi:uncharacterized protein (DUF2235 family)